MVIAPDDDREIIEWDLLFEVKADASSTIYCVHGLFFIG